MPGISLYMQPVQDLTIDTTVSRTQYQFVLEDADPDELADVGAEAGRQAQRDAASSTDVASDLEQNGLVGLHHDRPRHRGALRHHAGDRSTTRSTTPSASASSRPSSPRSNQYRVILEADPTLQTSVATCSTRSTCRRRPAAARCRCRPSPRCTSRPAPLQIDHLGQFPAAIVSFNLAPGASLGDGGRRDPRRRRRRSACRGSVVTSFQGAALAFQSSLSNELLLILAAIVTVYIVLGVLYESFIHPVTILSTLPSAGHRRAAGADPRRQRPRPSSPSSASSC